MKIRYIVLVCAVIISASLYYLFADEDLNPEIIAIQQQYAKPINLDNNVYIEMMSWQYLDSDNPYQLAVNTYKKQVKELRAISVREISPIRYPQVEFPSTEESIPYCDLNTESCIATIIEQSQDLTKLISDNQVYLNRFYKLAEFDNFQALNPLLVKTNYDFTVLYRLAALDILYKLESEQIEEAEKSITRLITIDRKFMATTNEFIFKIISISNFSQIHLPLITRLIVKKSNPKIDLLKPLTSEEITFNEVWRSELYYMISLLTSEDIFSKTKDVPNSQNFIMKMLMFKKHMTFNEIGEFYLTQVISTTSTKAQYFQDVKSMKDIIAEFHEQHEFYQRCSFCSIATNLNNIVGHLITITTMPKYTDLYSRIINIDLELQLLRLKVSNPKGVEEVILSKKQWQEPYLNSSPFIKSDKLCYAVADEVCIKR
ncbi:hypothetical protein MHM98_10565 [Psychrobium sp. MM17-31]|uniref:hypothetical protein n=1 Tax=Psychrobium sp. MM17-31 TaxID=2917758 RepID=UPI001EF54DDD|nr:hypothetical protein [Psychrobium sp. MM17-31]MCG7531784.1 hypothetical protein [Psychrobium sp. MM17-31]